MADGRATPARLAVGMALLAAALFGAAAPACKVLLDAIPAFQLAGLLYLGAAAAMVPVAMVERRSAVRRPWDAVNARRLFGAVLFGGAVGPVLLLVSLRLAPAGSVALLLNLEAVATAVLGALIFHEPLDRNGWAGVAGVVAAGALLSWQGGWPGVAAGLCAAGACLCWGLDNHLTALIDGLTPARSTLWKGAVAGSANLALGMVATPFAVAAGDAGAALAVGALCYGASIALYIGAAQQVGAVRAQAVFAGAPFIGAALSVWALGEPFGAAQLAAAALLLGSVALLFRSTHDHAHRHLAMEHLHSHRHDDSHHTHEHSDLAPSARHTHWHTHDELTHAHPHWPDLHHRHPHS